MQSIRTLHQVEAAEPSFGLFTKDGPSAWSAEATAVLDRMARVAGAAMGAPMAAVFVFEGNSHPVAGRLGLPASDADALHPLVHEIRSAQASMSFDDVSIGGFKGSAVGAPILDSKGACHGVVLVLHSAEGHRALAYDSHLMEDVCATAARSIEHMRFMQMGLEAASQDPLAAIIFDQETLKILAVNEATAAQYGYEVRELLQMSIVDLRPPTTIASLLDNVDRSRQGPASFKRCQHRRKDGSAIYVDAAAYPTVFRGRPATFLRAVEVTEHITAMEAHRRSERRYRSLIEGASDAIFVAEIQGFYQEVNSQACILTGYSREELLKMRPEDLIEPSSLRTMPMQWGPRDGHETMRLERDYLRKDGTTVPVEVSIRRIDDRLLHCIARDISDRKAVEEARAKANARLEELTKFYENALNELPIEVAILDSESRYRYINPAAIGDEELRQWLIGRTPLDYCDYRGLDPAPFEERVAWIRRIAETKKAASREETIVNKRGEVHHILRSGMPVLDADGNVERIFAYGVDLTDQKEYESRLIEAKERAEEMVRLKDAFLSNMSHEIRTPLTGILGVAQILADEAPESVRELVEMIHHSGTRLMDVLDSVITLAQLEAHAVEAEKHYVDVRCELAALVEAVRPDAESRGLELRAFLPEQPVRSHLDRSHFQKAVGVLLENAVKFTQEGHVHVHLLRSGDDSFEIRIEDSGVGIDSAHVADMFEAFTQESNGLDRGYEGCGLGLTIAKLLVREMEGTIDLHSRKHEGTTARVNLPAS